MLRAPRSGDLGGSHRLGALNEAVRGQAAVFRQGRGIHDRADGAETVPDPPVSGQEAAAAAGGAGDLEQCPEVPLSRPNSSRVASVKNSGRSSSARHKSAVSTARTGSGRGRPVRWASAASMTGAVPLRSMSPAAKATTSSPIPPRPAAGSARRSWRALRAAAGMQRRFRGVHGGHVAGIPGQGIRLGDPADLQQHRQRRAGSEMVADEAARHRPADIRGRSAASRAAKALTKPLYARSAGPGQNTNSPPAARASPAARPA